jgi:copper chaperone NosL
MRILGAALGAVMLIAGGCGVNADGPPAIELDRSACSHCGMLISEPLYAAAYRTSGGDTRVFDDIGCLRNAARAETATLRYWFHDANDRGWVDGGGATFVASAEIRSPMGGGVLAYRDPGAAERSAAARHGRVIRSVADLLGKEGGS